MHRESIHGTRECFPWVDHLWQGGTTYGTVDGPGGPSVAAVLGPGGPSTATKTCRRWSGGTDFGGTIHGMTGSFSFANGTLKGKLPFCFCTISVRYCFYLVLTTTANSYGNGCQFYTPDSTQSLQANAQDLKMILAKEAENER